MPLSPSTIEAVARGRTCFNEGDFYEAHEAWEVAWRVEQGEARRFLQGLIHVATALYHATVRGRPAGAVKLLASGLALLEPFPDGFGGLALAPFRSSVGLLLEGARGWERGERGPLEQASLPKLETAAASGSQEPP
jgi:predicted metal-dependent hydrolase